MSTFTKSTFTRKAVAVSASPSPSASASSPGPEPVMGNTINRNLPGGDMAGVYRSIYHGQALTSTGLAELDGLPSLSPPPLHSLFSLYQIFLNVIFLLN